MAMYMYSTITSKFFFFQPIINMVIEVPLTWVFFHVFSSILWFKNHFMIKSFIASI